MDAIRKKMQSLKEKFNKKLNDKNEVMTHSRDWSTSV